jgi:hypothetical protein
MPMVVLAVIGMLCGVLALAVLTGLGLTVRGIHLSRPNEAADAKESWDDEVPDFVR